MPFGRFHRYRGRSKYHRYNRSARSIQNAWKRKKRRHTSLISRTTQANRKTIRAMKKCIETKMVEDHQAIYNPVGMNPFSGQFCDNMTVDNEGVSVADQLPFSGDLLRVEMGDGSDKRVGAWIHMKSLTLKYCVTLVGTTEPNTLVTVLLVLDRQPRSVLSLDDIYKSQSTISPPVQPANKFNLAFQNLQSNSGGGEKGRFKILYRKQHRVSNPQYIRAGAVPAITQAAQGSQMRPIYYNSQWVSTQYPPNAYGSHTITNKYKLNYGANFSGTINQTPQNQSIKLLAYTDQAGEQATLQYYARFRFHDP